MAARWVFAVVFCLTAAPCYCVRPVAFVHVPKTAGSTLTAAFAELWEGRGCLKVDFDNAATVSALTTAAKYSLASSPSQNITLRNHGTCLWANLHAGPDNDQRASFVQGILNGTMPPLTFVAAHMPHGLCTFMRPGCKYITVLREPISRVLSHYYYVRNTHPDYLDSICDNCTTVEGFARELAAGRVRDYGIDNMQTRMIAGDAFWTTISKNNMCKMALQGCDLFNPSTQQMLRRAMINLRNYMAVGIMEDIESFAVKMGIRGLSQGKGLNKGIDYSSELSSETAALLRKTQSLDLRLYKFAKELARRPIKPSGIDQANEAD
jgi:hypothetical protein